MSGRKQFVIDTADLSKGARVEAIQFVLDLFDPDAATFECDLPLSNRDAWTQSVGEAADVLCGACSPRRGDSAIYRTTGILRRSEDVVWQSFKTFAPFAFDATVWDSSSRALIELNDEGTSAWASLTDEQASLILERYSVQGVLLKEWRVSKRWRLWGRNPPDAGTVTAPNRRT